MDDNYREADDTDPKATIPTPAEYPPKPAESESPNTPARPVTEDDYRPPEPPDVYQQRPQDSPNIRRG